MFVYRVENKEGYGPYQGGHAFTFRHHNNRHTHPTPVHEKYRRFSYFLDASDVDDEDVRHGFVSLSHYQQWFNLQDRKKLEELDYRLVKYKVPIRYAHILAKQVQFVDGYAEKVEVLHVNTLQRLNTTIYSNEEEEDEILF